MLLSLFSSKTQIYLPVVLSVGILAPKVLFPFVITEQSRMWGLAQFPFTQILSDYADLHLV